MKPSRPEVADIFAEHFGAFDSSRYVPKEERRVAADLVACRTAVLGGHMLECSYCGHGEISYNSCRNRHCPKCQAAARAKWLEARAEDLLEVPYFHVVFTLPAKLASVALQNKAAIYGLLIRSAAESLVTIARDERHLGAQLGVITVLHTWGQTLLHHPHVHCVVPGGGLSLSGKAWVSSRPDFLVSVRVLSRLFRRIMLEGLELLRARGELALHGKLETLRGNQSWRDFTDGLCRSEWVVYAKPPFGGSLQVLKYLARYTHRVAISNNRLRPAANGEVAFSWKDYACGNQLKIMRLSATEFIRRFLLHVLPSGFQRIRYYGFLSNRAKQPALLKIRKLLETECGLESTKLLEDKIEPAQITLARTCPVCRQGLLILIEQPLPLPRTLGQLLANQGRPP